MTQHRFESAPPISLQSHPGVVNQSAFSDCRIARAAGQPHGQRRRGPLALLYRGDFFLLMYALVVTFKIVEPNSAPGGNGEGAGFVGCAAAIARNQVTEGEAVVVSARFKNIVGFSGDVPDRDSGAVTVVCGLRVSTAGCVSLVQPVAM